MNHEQKKNVFTTAAIVISVIGIMLSIAIPTYFYSKKKNVEQFQPTGWMIKRCPFPLNLEALGKHSAATKLAAISLNIELQDLGLGPIFGKRKTPEKPTIKVVDSLDGMVCKKLNLGPEPPVDDKELKMADFNWNITREGDLESADVFVCGWKYKATRSALNKPSWLKLLPLQCYIKHELGHALIGKEHPGTGCGLMCQNINTCTLSASTKAIIKRIYEPLCGVKR